MRVPVTAAMGHIGATAMRGSAQGPGGSRSPQQARQVPLRTGRRQLMLGYGPAGLTQPTILDMFCRRSARERYRDFLPEETDAATRASSAEWEGGPWGQTRRV